MGLLHFDEYTFDPIAAELRREDAIVALRPKTAELLRELITRRDAIVHKRELIRRLWHTEHVTDQSVFQAISELRSALAPLHAIRTFPNRGYQWVLPVVETRRSKRAAVVALAASVVLGAALVITHYRHDVPAEPSHSVTHELNSPVHALPAMLAFSEGAAALQRGDTQMALDRLALSVSERPGFVEARLMLAEAYLLSGNVLEARQRADNVMRSGSAATNAYATIAAMDLISRADQQLGQMNSALEWATRAADRAHSNGFECTAADLHDRVLALVQSHDFRSAPLASPVFASEFAQRLLRTAFGQNARGLAEDQDAAESAERPHLAQSPLPSAGPSAGESALVDGLFGDTRINERPAHCARYRGESTGRSLPIGLPGSSPLWQLAAHAEPKPLI